MSLSTLYINFLQGSYSREGTRRCTIDPQSFLHTTYYVTRENQKFLQAFHVTKFVAANTKYRNYSSIPIQILFYFHLQNILWKICVCGFIYLFIFLFCAENKKKKIRTMFFFRCTKYVQSKNERLRLQFFHPASNMYHTDFR